MNDSHTLKYQKQHNTKNGLRTFLDGRHYKL